MSLEKNEIPLIPVWIEKPIVKYKEEFGIVTTDGKYELHSAKVTFSKKKGKAWGWDSEWTQRSLSIPKQITDLTKTFVFFEQLENGDWQANFFQPLGEHDIIKGRV